MVDVNRNNSFEEGLLDLVNEEEDDAKSVNRMKPQ